MQRVGKTAEDVEFFLQEIIEERYSVSYCPFDALWLTPDPYASCRGEGLVLKRGRSAYSLGGREGKWWAKVSNLPAFRL